MVFVPASGLPGKKKPDPSDSSPTDGQVVTWNDANQLADWQDAPGAGGGEANTASNVGLGEGLAKTKVLEDLPFKSIIGGTGITAVGNADDVTLNHDNHTGDVTGSTALTIANNAVTLAKMADMATASILGRNTAATGDPEVIAQVSAGEKTAGTATALRGFSPKDVADMAGTHGGGGGSDISCKATKSGTQSIPSNTLTAVTFDGTDEYDTDTMHDPVTNNDRMTFTTAGKYLVVFWIDYETGGIDYDVVNAQIRLNGTSTVLGKMNFFNGGNARTSIVVTVLHEFAASDYVIGHVYHNNASARNITADCTFAAQKVN